MGLILCFQWFLLDLDPYHLIRIRIQPNFWYVSGSWEIIRIRRIRIRNTGLGGFKIAPNTTGRYLFLLIRSIFLFTLIFNHFSVTSCNLEPLSVLFRHAVFSAQVYFYFLTSKTLKLRGKRSQRSGFHQRPSALQGLTAWWEKLSRCKQLSTLGLFFVINFAVKCTSLNKMVKTKKSVFCRGVAFMSLAWRFEIDQLVLNDFYVVKIKKIKI